MIKKTETIQVVLTNYGTLEVVTMPTKLYKDSYNVVKLSCVVPKSKQDGEKLLKVYGVGQDESGESVFTTQTYNLPYKEDTIINGFEYLVYESFLPREFTNNINFYGNGGDIKLVFSHYNNINIGGEDLQTILVSGTLNLFVSGFGLNTNGVEISNYDATASKVNEIISNYVKHEELQAIDDKITNLDIPENLSDLNNDMGFVVQQDIINALVDYYKKSETYSREEVDNLVSVTSSLSILVVDQLPTEDISTTTIYLLRNNGESPNLYDEYIYVRGQWEYLGSQSFEISANTLAGAIEDSESIVSMVDGDKLKFELDADLTSKISKSLTVPMSAPSSTELVAIDDGNSQTMISIGSGLKLEDGVLSSTDGGTSSTINVVDNLSSQSTTDALSAKQGNVLYNMIVESGSGGAGTQVKVAGQVQSEINFNTDPVVPVDFAEEERQKSKNLFNINAPRVVQGGHSFVNGNTITVEAGGSTETDAVFGLIPVKENTTYYIGANASNKRLLFRIYDENKNVITSAIPNWVYNQYWECSYADFSSTEIRTQLTIPSGAKYLAFSTAWLGSEQTFSNVIISEYPDIDNYQPYNGAIVHEKEIADVEHIEVIYNMADPEKQTFAGRTYTAGIPPETYTQDVSKYKKLRVHMGVDYSRNVVEVDLTCPNASNSFVGTNAVSFEIYQSKFYGHSGYVDVSADKRTIAMAFNKIQGTSQSSAGNIYKIEGVY